MTTPGATGLRAVLGDLVHRYAALADQRRRAELGALFVPDGQLVVPSPPERLSAHQVVAGPTAIAEHLAVLDGLDRTVHAIVGEVYDLTGPGRASGRVACVAHHVSGGRDVVWHLHYEDRYREDDGRWRFQRRELHIDLIATAQVRGVGPD